MKSADAKFKEFLDSFQKLGIADRTLFVMSSDHGTELYEHRRFDHGFSLYSELTHVPLILKLPPGGATGVEVSHAASSIDVMPTILDLLDIPLDASLAKQLRGTSLAAAAKGKSNVRDIFSEPTAENTRSNNRSSLPTDGS